MTSLPAWVPTSPWTLLSYSALALLAYLLYHVLQFGLLQPLRRHLLLLRSGVKGPTFVPFLGHILAFNAYFSTSRFLEWGRDYIRQHGDPFQYHIGPFTIVHTADPDVILSAWKTQHGYYHKGVFAKTMLGPLLGPNSLVLIDEPQHGTNRVMLSPAFHFAHLRSMTSIMVDETVAAIQQLFTPSPSSDTSSPSPPSSSSSSSVRVELHRWFTDLSLTVIVTSSFGNSLSHIPDAKTIIHHSLTVVLDLMQMRSLSTVGQIPIIRDLPILGKVETERGRAQLQAVVQQMVRDRRAGRSHSSCEGRDLLDLLLSARDERTGEAFSDEQVRSPPPPTPYTLASLTPLLPIHLL